MMFLHFLKKITLVQLLCIHDMHTHTERYINVCVSGRVYVNIGVLHYSMNHSFNPLPTPPGESRLYNLQVTKTKLKRQTNRTQSPKGHV